MHIDVIRTNLLTLVEYMEGMEPHSHSYNGFYTTTYKNIEFKYIGTEESVKPLVADPNNVYKMVRFPKKIGKLIVPTNAMNLMIVQQVNLEIVLSNRFNPFMIELKLIEHETTTSFNNITTVYDGCALSSKINGYSFPYAKFVNCQFIEEESEEDG